MSSIVGFPVPCEPMFTTFDHCKKTQTIIAANCFVRLNFLAPLRSTFRSGAIICTLERAKPYYTFDVSLLSLYLSLQIFVMVPSLFKHDPADTSRTCQDFGMLNVYRNCRSQPRFKSPDRIQKLQQKESVAKQFPSIPSSGKSSIRQMIGAKLLGTYNIETPFSSNHTLHAP
ncbi:hypothetical protein BgiBS90_013058 [Biomphalaria glabrata]|nr:hypothetical protein BgiBS90_013058 [Biomphalaria glabrata]